MKLLSIVAGLVALLAAGFACATPYSAGVDVGDSTRVFGQMNINPSLDAELGYAQMNHTYGATVDSVELAAVPGMNVAPNVRLYGRAGIANTGATYRGYSTGRHNGLLLGVGAQYQFTPNVAARAEYDQYKNVAGLADVDRTTLGLKYSF